MASGMLKDYAVLDLSEPASSDLLRLLETAAGNEFYMVSGMLKGTTRFLTFSPTQRAQIYCAILRQRQETNSHMAPGIHVKALRP